MAKIPFVPSDLLFELKIKIFKMNLVHLHPADINALLMGAIDGLSASKSLLLANYTSSYVEQLTELFVEYEDGKPTTQLVAEINKKVITRDILKQGDFSSWSTYGTSKSAPYYIDGFVLAHAWAMQLYGSAKSHGIEPVDARGLAVKQIDLTNPLSVA